MNQKEDNVLVPDLKAVKLYYRWLTVESVLLATLCPKEETCKWESKKLRL